MVFATALRITQDAALAEDVTQEVFLSLARQRFDHIECMAAWLHRVAWVKARNVVASESRRRRREEAAAEFIHELNEATWDEIEPAVDEVLASLPEKIRTLLIEHYLEQRTQDEMAKRHGISQATVSRQLEGGLKLLRRGLKTRGVVGGACLEALLSSQPLIAAPSTLTASLGKLSISGIGTGSPASTVFVTSTFIAMTTTTKILLGSAAVATLAFFLVPKPDHPKPPLLAAASTVEPTREKAAGSVPEPKRYRPPPASGAVQRKTDDIIRRFRHKSLKELSDEPEIQDIHKRFFALINHPETQRQLGERLALLKDVSGLERGTIQIGGKGLDTPFSRAIIEAALADDRKLAEDVLFNQLDGAIFEFSIDPDQRESSDSVIITPSDKPFKSTSAED